VAPLATVLHQWNFHFIIFGNTFLLLDNAASARPITIALEVNLSAVETLGQRERVAFVIWIYGVWVYRGRKDLGILRLR
jgi:hypothetical protein